MRCKLCGMIMDYDDINMHMEMYHKDYIMIEITILPKKERDEISILDFFEKEVK